MSMPSFLSGIVAIIRWQDVLDILLNSYILFRLYILLRGTRLLRIAIFIAVLLLLQRAIAFSGMIITNTVIQYITALIAIGVLIVFRYEIRSLFQAKSFRDIFWRITQPPTRSPIEILVESAFRLTSQRIGALLVFPGRQSLDGLLQGGIAWQGKISQEMIESIFWPDNPVHDGAAVIVGQRVAMVSVILPLSEKSDLPSKYGTRHRAALGLAEKSDALVVVVSEERSAIEVAKGGKLHSMANRQQLEAALRHHLGSGVVPAVRQRSERWSSALAAAVSFLIIFSIWSSLSLGVVRTLTTVEAPVEYVKRDPDMEIIETSATSVKIQLSGSRGMIGTLTPNQIKVRFDLTQAKPGLNTYTVTEENISLPPGINIKKVDPPQVNVLLDALGQKTLPVQVDWSGTLPAGILIQDVKVDPPQLTVSGGQLLLKDIQTLYTAKIPVDDIQHSGVREAPVVLDPPSLKLPPGQPTDVQVRFTVRWRSQEEAP
jgi:diadenylate cyclase